MALRSSMMGYDRAITVFSPNGRLLQVEYAREAVSQGTPAVGIKYKEGVLIIGDRRVVEKLLVPDSIEKIFQIDKHIGATVSGLISDGRVIIDKAREIAQEHRTRYDEPIDVKTLVKDVCDHKQLYTQYGGTRPYGVSLIIGGVDESPRLFITEPAGIFFEYNACAIGENSEKVMEYLSKNYKKDMSFKEAVKLGFNALKNVIGKNFGSERLEGAYIDTKNRKFKKIPEKMLK